MKKLVTMVLILGMVACMSLSLPLSAFAISGSGTEADPYLISTPSDLLLITDFQSAHFKLTNNINLNDNYGGWPITTSFSGTLDGDGYVIIGLNRAFVSTNTGTIKNLIVQIDGLEKTGFIMTNEGTIENVSIFGSEIYMRMANSGTFVGSNYGTIRNCWSSVGMEVQGMYVSSDVGGFAGYNKGIIENCCYNGYLWSSGTTPNGEKTYAYISPFIGTNAEESADYVNDGGKVYNCYYDVENTADAQKNSGGATRKFSDALKMQATYTNWDFNNVWAIDSSVNNGYPYLRCDRRFNSRTEQSTGNLNQSAGNTDTIVVKLNGEPITFDQQPIIIDGRTLVPLRAIFEALGATVNWYDPVVLSRRGNVEIAMMIGNNIMTKDIYSGDDVVSSEEITLDVVPRVMNGRTLVPVRAIAEAFDCKVFWDENTQTVSIIK